MQQSVSWQLHRTVTEVFALLPGTSCTGKCFFVGIGWLVKDATPSESNFIANYVTKKMGILRIPAL